MLGSEAMLKWRQREVLRDVVQNQSLEYFGWVAKE